MFSLLGVFLFLLVAGGLVWCVEALMWKGPDSPAGERHRSPVSLRPPRRARIAPRPRCLLNRNRWAMWLPIPLPFFTRRLAILIVIKF
jgi:hypothetical protein